jgi:hypothetical protein
MKKAKRIAMRDMLSESVSDKLAMGVVKPFFLIHEKDILLYSKSNINETYPLYQ